MRVNPNLVLDTLADLQQNQTKLHTALQELSSGKRVAMPSDNPSASARMVQNTIDSADVDQYTQNVNSALAMVQTADSALSSVVSLLTTAISMGTEGANGVNNAGNREAIALQVQGILKSVLNDANLSYQGSYLFGGTNSSIAPYTANPVSSSGYAYNGNDGTISVAVGDNTSVQLNLPGGQIFSDPDNDVLGSLSSLISALRRGSTSDISTATETVNSALGHVSQQRVFYGNAESQLNAQEIYLQRETVSLSSQATSLVGVDMAEAATDFAQAQTANSATLAVVAKILPTTLLNYLSLSQ